MTSPCCEHGIGDASGAGGMCNMVAAAKPNGQLGCESDRIGEEMPNFFAREIFMTEQY